MKQRLDQRLSRMGLAATRSQAENLIKLGQVLVNGQAVDKPGRVTNDTDQIKLKSGQIYVSRAANKLEQANKLFKVSFKGKTVLDVGSSTGGFTQYALLNGAKSVVAVDVGTNQMNPALANDERVELHEKTDIRSFKTAKKFDIILVDVSFISLKMVLPAVSQLSTSHSLLVVMAKPQFEAPQSAKHKGVIKNQKLRRQVLNDLENWVKNLFVLMLKTDSKVPGSKGNIERFYLLKKRL